jgi:hypothetical protein
MQAVSGRAAGKSRRGGIRLRIYVEMAEPRFKIGPRADLRHSGRRADAPHFTDRRGVLAATSHARVIASYA